MVFSLSLLFSECALTAPRPHGLIDYVFKNKGNEILYLSGYKTSQTIKSSIDSAHHSILPGESFTVTTSIDYRAGFNLGIDTISISYKNKINYLEYTAQHVGDFLGHVYVDRQLLLNDNRVWSDSNRTNNIPFKTSLIFFCNENISTACTVSSVKGDHDL